MEATNGLLSSRPRRKGCEPTGARRPRNANRKLWPATDSEFSTFIAHAVRGICLRVCIRCRNGSGEASARLSLEPMLAVRYEDENARTHGLPRTQSIYTHVDPSQLSRVAFQTYARHGTHLSYTPGADAGRHADIPAILPAH